MPLTSFQDAQAATLDRYGVTARSHWIERGNTRAHVLVGGAGPPVVMLNGLGTPAAMWAPLMAQLTGLRTHAIDLPGFGLTALPDGFASGLPTTAIGFVRDVLDGLGLDRPTIVANSLGSLWASWFAAGHPHRVGALVHIGCPALAPGTSAPFPMRLMSSRSVGGIISRLSRPSERQVRRVAKMVHEHPLPVEIADLLLATERLPSFDRAFAGLLHALLRIRGARAELALTAEQLARVKPPTLLVIGRDDPFGSAEAGQWFVDAQPDARLCTVDGGHAPWLHHAATIAPLVADFLADVSRVDADM